MKRCPRCETVKPDSEYYKDKYSRARDNLSGYCKTCVCERVKIHQEKNRERRKLYARVWYAKNKHTQRERTLIRNYGITAKDFDAMLEKQRGRCAICQKHHTECPKGRCSEVALLVDHDHHTGKIRGLLCHHCNHRLDLFTTKEIVKRTLAYISQ